MSVEPPAAPVANRSLLTRFWHSERWLSAMLLLLCLAMFVGGPLLASGKIGTYVFDVLFSLLLISGVIAVAQNALVTTVMAILVVVTVALRWTTQESPESVAWIWADALAVVLLVSFAVLVLVQVLKGGPITSHRIQGAIAVYLLIGLAFGSAYEVIYRLSPNAFNIQASPTHGLLYFSFVTLTTLGYGDITPLHPVARTLATCEALTGQLYMAIMIARLVTLQISAKEGR